MPAPINPFKAALARAELQLGCWAGFADPYATEVLATAGFDWLVIDGEHAPNDLRSIMAQLQVLEGKQSHAVVRLPIGHDWMIKQVLDAGAQTLLIPMVDSAEQARHLVRAMRYPPAGIRGAGAALARASRFSDIEDYVATADDQMCLLVQVESRKGLEALDDILAVDGVDGVFIGPADLAADMGYGADSSARPVADAIRDALERIAASSKAAGILALDPDTAGQYRDWGAQFLAVGIDVLMLARTARATVSAWNDRRKID
ncbi:MAG: HpcH/HpaI aldolase/citrate lyase family protein [Sediminimonas qiaohouensis]|uniref:Hydroxypyruvate/pyruvate aldolase n=1 Tax=Sediminimonas qiaohouensis TaxID=552061 RepID=A0A7C9L949_9RHOB|nr:HpcH/HpaI aldolase/citrate lyase family protein [Sediminimonas qiaohouensis]MTJ05434.1 HpcH/HpaI aldolase/citrate lyase family protein [Sediminimonas qiaohouensis]